MASFNTDGKTILGVFIGVIIVIVFLQTIGDSVFSQTNTIFLGNSTVTAPAVNGTLDLTGRELVGSAVVTNASNVTGADLAALGVNVATGLTSGGALTVQLSVNDTGAIWAAQGVNISYTYKPEGYLNDAGSRSITKLILIFGALAVVVFVIVMFIKSGSLGRLLKT